LVRVDGFQLLEHLFDQDIVIPSGVLKEYSRSFPELPSSVIVREVAEEQQNRINFNLGRGEREAIALAQELGALLIIEDRKARKACEQIGIEKIGTFAIVRAAFEECLLTREQMVEMVGRLKNDLYYRDSLINWVLEARKPNAN